MVVMFFFIKFFMATLFIHLQLSCSYKVSHTELTNLVCEDLDMYNSCKYCYLVYLG